jgi:hypothetical protein
MAGVLALAGLRATAARASQPIGVHSMLQLNTPYPFMQTMFADAAAMHAGMIRLDVAPALVFPAGPALPDFLGLHEIMALSEQYHLPVVADLLTIPTWIAPSCQIPAVGTAVARCATDDTAAYAAMLRQIAAQAAPVITDWEVWNEPDNGQFFNGTPDQYADMLRAAHDAIKGVEPGANVLLGGLSGPQAMGWLSRVFAAPGADAATAFDTANVHERNQLDRLGPDIDAWRAFLTRYGFTGPLWVTEHGYPSDPAYQFDSAYRAGLSSQAAYLSASIPTLLDAGASRVFVTERDNLSGSFASEGLLGGNVGDPPVADPSVVVKPAYAAVAHLAGCYRLLGRSCPGPPPTVVASTNLPPAPPGGSSAASALIVAAWTGPVQLGTPSVEGPGAGVLSVHSDQCPAILEPGRGCSIGLRFRPRRPGRERATFSLPSDNGSVRVPLTTVAPSVSSLRARQRSGRGRRTVVLALVNPLIAPVHVMGLTMSRGVARRLSLEDNRCRGVELNPRRWCAISLRVRPGVGGRGLGGLTIHGEGRPLIVALRMPPARR